MGVETTQCFMEYQLVLVHSGMRRWTHWNSGNPLMLHLGLPKKQKHFVSFDGNELYFFSLAVTWLIHLPGNGFEGNGSNFGSVTS